MLAVYDPLCEGLRDPEGVPPRPVFSWRLGSDHAGVCQAAWRVVVTSMDDGERRWDSGPVASGDNRAPYAGVPLTPGETCVWFVTVTDGAGEEACGVPASFVVGGEGAVPSSPLGAERTALVWTSDERLDKELGPRAEDPALWAELLGLVLEHDALARVKPDLQASPLCELAFAQVSVLAPRGLLVARVERGVHGAELGVSLPPGMRAELGLGELCRAVGPGRHRLKSE